MKFNLTVASTAVDMNFFIRKEYFNTVASSYMRGDEFVMTLLRHEFVKTIFICELGVNFMNLKHIC